MKQILLASLIFFFGLSKLNAQAPPDNDFYNDSPTQHLKTVELTIEGEIGNPGKVDFSKLPVRSVIVKETLLNGSSDKFVGAYRYDGYSLYDILADRVLKKKNEAEYPPIIDLYVEIENAAGEKVVVSWGEIYYPIHRYEIIIAHNVARIVPSKTKELWPLPTDSKLVVSSDLVTERNISNPTKITVKSYSKSFPINKGMSPMYCPKIKVFNGAKQIDSITKYPTGYTMATFPAIFYGRGMGIHSVTPFYGFMIKDYFAKYFPMSKENLQKGMFTVVGLDGYHCVYTYSEVMNRNDQAELLFINHETDKNEGAYSLFPAMDFFSDRAIKAAMEFHFNCLGINKLD